MVLAVNSWDEPKPMLKIFQSQHDITYPLLQNGGDVAMSYGIGTGVPVNIWIRPDGTIMNVDVEYHGPKPLISNTQRLLHPGG